MVREGKYTTHFVGVIGSVEPYVQGLKSVSDGQAETQDVGKMIDPVWRELLCDDL